MICIYFCRHLHVATTSTSFVPSISGQVTMKVRFRPSTSTSSATKPGKTMGKPRENGGLVWFYGGLMWFDGRLHNC